MPKSIGYPAQFFSKKLQLGQNQVSAIHSAIMSRDPGCNMLVFGCGYDSSYWMATNRRGYTLFVEDSQTWAAQFKSLNPKANILTVNYDKLTVKNSLPARRNIASHLPLPNLLRERLWDVILIDAPAGYAPNNRGRAAAISWTASIADKTTHVFIDDAERTLENNYADLFFSRLRPDGPVIVKRSPQSESIMYWYPGIDLARYRIFLKYEDQSENLLKLAASSKGGDILVFDNISDVIISAIKHRAITESSVVIVRLDKADDLNNNFLNQFITDFDSVDSRISSERNLIFCCHSNSMIKIIRSDDFNISVIGEYEIDRRPMKKIGRMNGSHLTESARSLLLSILELSPSDSIEDIICDTKTFLKTYSNGRPISIRSVY